MYLIFLKYFTLFIPHIIYISVFFFSLMVRNEVWVHAEAPRERTWTPGNHGNAGKLVSCVFLYQHQTNIDLLRSHLKWLLYCCCVQLQHMWSYLLSVITELYNKGLWVNSCVHVTRIINWIYIIICSYVLETVNNKQFTV